VEDNDDNVYMLKMRLELLDNFEVVVAENGEKGCAMALSERPDIILMDLEMPVVDGWEATRRLKADPQTRAIPVIALSAHAPAASAACAPPRAKSAWLRSRKQKCRRAQARTLRGAGAAGGDVGRAACHLKFAGRARAGVQHDARQCDAYLRGEVRQLVSLREGFVSSCRPAAFASLLCRATA